jgi:branched-chain amino acid transport system permease protein
MGFREAHPFLWRALTTLVLVGIALVVTGVVAPLTNFYLAQGACWAIVIVGLSFLTGTSGQVSLGNGAFMGAGAFGAGIWALHHPSTWVVGLLGISVLVGAAAGLVVGLPATRLRGPYLAGMTIAVAIAFTFILTQFSSWTGGTGGVEFNTTSPPGWFSSLTNSSTVNPGLRPTDMWLADIAIITAGVAFFFMANLFQSRLGRGMRLVRDNEVAAELAGISLPRARVVAFMVSAAYAGLGGGMYAIIQGGSGAQSFFNLGISIQLLSLLVIGGIGSLSGALLAGLFFTYSPTWISSLEGATGISGTSNLGSSLDGIIFGGLLIVVMLVAPYGITGTTKHLVLRSVGQRRARSLARRDAAQGTAPTGSPPSPSMPPPT